MKVTGARTEPLSATRRRAATAPAGSATAGDVARADSSTFLGISRAEMTPAVQQAIENVRSSPTPAGNAPAGNTPAGNQAAPGGNAPATPKKRNPFNDILQGIGR